MSRGIDFLITYRVVKMLITPFEKMEAFKTIIDKDGKVLIKYKNVPRSKKRHYTLLHRFVFNLKRYSKSWTRFKTWFICCFYLLLIKEDKSYAQHKDVLESTIIKYLKEENLYDEMLAEEGDIPEIEIDQEPYMTCFGIDVYERGDELVSEKEYAQLIIKK